MKEAIAYEGQSIIDQAIKQYGHIEAVVQLSKDNNLGVDAQFAGVKVLVVDESMIPVYQIKKALTPEKVIATTRKVKLATNQNLIDLCLQEYGSLDQLVALHRDNGLSVINGADAGSELMILNSRITDNSFVPYLKKKGRKIVTGGASGLPEGILLNDDGTPILTDDGHFIFT